MGINCVFAHSTTILIKRFEYHVKSPSNDSETLLLTNHCQEISTSKSPAWHIREYSSERSHGPQITNKRYNKREDAQKNIR